MAEKGGSEEERIVSGGATSFPRRSPRPEYPAASGILTQQLLRTLRGPALAALAAKFVVGPLFARLADWWVNKKGLSEATLFGFATTALHVVVYAICNGTFALWDHMEWMQQYKLARKPAQLPTTEQIKAVVKDFVLGLPVGFLAATGLYGVYQKKGAPGVLAELPSAATMYWQFVFAYYFNMFGFYFAHRLVHSKQLYKLIHKQHHTFIGTVGVAAENASMPEQLIANQFPTALGCLVVNAHPVVWLTWLIWRLEETFEAHSGFCFAGTFLHNIGLTNADSAAYHDHHHVENKGNFGFELTDWMFGTMDDWVATGGMEGYVKKAREAYEAKMAEEKKKKQQAQSTSN